MSTIGARYSVAQGERAQEQSEIISCAHCGVTSEEEIVHWGVPDGTGQTAHLCIECEASLEAGAHTSLSQAA